MGEIRQLLMKFPFGYLQSYPQAKRALLDCLRDQTIPDLETV